MYSNAVRRCAFIASFEQSCAVSVLSQLWGFGRNGVSSVTVQEASENYFSAVALHFYAEAVR
jgi:hypothetical protein